MPHPGRVGLRIAQFRRWAARTLLRPTSVLLSQRPADVAGEPHPPR